MTPRLPEINFKRQIRGDSFGRSHSGFPKTEYNYQSSSLADFGGRCGDDCKSSRSFREISASYSKREARHSFIAEAAFFVLIIITAAVPVIEGARAMSDLVRSFGAL